MTNPGDLEGLDDERNRSAVPIIPRDSVLPLRRTERACTTIDDPQRVSFPIVQGEGPRVGDNMSLGTLSAEDLPPSPAGSRSRRISRPSSPHSVRPCARKPRDCRSGSRCSPTSSSLDLA